MSEEERNLAFQKELLEVQKKYGIRDGDPAFAVLELVHLYLRKFPPSPSGLRSPSFEEFRESIEILDQRTKTFAKHAAELIQELRKRPAATRQMWIWCGVILLVLILLALLAGIAIGKFAL